VSDGTKRSNKQKNQQKGAQYLCACVPLKNSSCLLGANSASNKTKPRHGKIKHHFKIMFILFFLKRYLLSNRIQNSTA
jgi:hypothetical protein